MRKRILFFVVCLSLFTAAKAQHVLFPKENARIYRSDSTVKLQKRPLLAGFEVFSTNMLVWSFDKFVLNADYAQINSTTIKENLSSFPVWDGDKFSTNLFFHPYHGGLYFNVARSNGMGFWTSGLYTFGGSLMWEYFMETERPSLNDLYATTIGGICLGEMTFRLSDLFIDNSSCGMERFARELLVACISPMRGLNRLLTGQSWKLSTSKGRQFAEVPFYFSPFVGTQVMTDYRDVESTETSARIGFNLVYGQPLNESDGEYYKPYEWFTLYAAADLFSNQPVLTDVNAIAILFGKNVGWQTKGSLTLGAFQHFDFYDSRIRDKSGMLVSPYRLSEAAAFGLGAVYVRDSIFSRPLDFRSSMYLNGILLGGTLSDSYLYNERDYNFGSGASVKLYGGLTYKKRWSFDLSADHYYIYTWRTTDQNGFSSSQGDRGHAHLTVLSPFITYHSNQKWSIIFRNRHFFRSTYYNGYSNMKFSTSDFVITFSYLI